MRFAQKHPVSTAGLRPFRAHNTPFVTFWISLLEMACAPHPNCTKTLCMFCLKSRLLCRHRTAAIAAGVRIRHIVIWDIALQLRHWTGQTPDIAVLLACYAVTIRQSTDLTVLCVIMQEQSGERGVKVGGKADCRHHLQFKSGSGLQRSKCYQNVAQQSTVVFLASRQWKHR